MKIDPGFISHWKTERLIEQLGAEGVLVVMRLWSEAQIRRQYSGLELNPRKLALKTKWLGDENLLWETLTDPDAPWLDDEGNGTYAIHGFAEHQHQVVKLWENGKRGGRPPKAKKDAPDINTNIPTDTSTSSYSSSYPKCDPFGNHMVNSEGVDGAEDGSRKPNENHMVSEFVADEEQAMTQLVTAGVPENFGRYIFADWESRGGKDASGVAVAWIKYAKKRWNREGQEWQARSHKGNRPAGTNGHGKPSVRERETARTGIAYSKELNKL
jgi:hypothetical protein